MPQDDKLKTQDWLLSRQYTDEKFALAQLVLMEIKAGKTVAEAVRKHPLPDGGYLGKHLLVAAYRQLTRTGKMPPDVHLLMRLRMKPIRSLSGVTVVTVLTKPYPCPGRCIFCPSDERMPKSYLPDEPGAMRGLQYKFDPYAQVAARLDALHAVGHPTDKIELLVLGGTWSAYPKTYQEWFITRCLEALNDNQVHSAVSVEPSFVSLQDAQTRNESAHSRNVGLAIETRPDHVNEIELAWWRYLGVTKIQLGVQSLDDDILALNQRGHTVAETHHAANLLRLAGFKIVIHWMPNLLGSTQESDSKDFARLWDGICPDEIKIYPTQLLENTELYAYWQRGEYTPYSTDELIDIIAKIKTSIPRYCRVNRVVRDIPSTHVIAGSKRSSLRQDVQVEMKKRGTSCQCIRCREIRKQLVDQDELSLNDIVYQTDSTEEHFLSYVTASDQLAGFLRLTLPGSGKIYGSSLDLGLSDLKEAALIREVHIYGQSLELGEKQLGSAQHSGLGTKLLLKAEMIAQKKGYERLAVIAAIGTRGYYLQRGYRRGDLYLTKDLRD